MLRSSRSRFGTLLALAILLTFGFSAVGCSDDEGGGSSGANNTTNANNTSDVGDDTAGGDAVDGDTAEGDTTGPTPGSDTDGDGINDDVEATSGTDYLNPDSDGDGLCDGPGTVPGVCVGGEDINANGIVDPGEFDPRKEDSSGIGVSDGETPGSPWVVCNADTINALSASPARNAETNMALPDGFVIVDHPDAGAASFTQSSTGIYGYIIKTNSALSPAAAFRSFEGTASDSGNVRTNALWKLFTPWLPRFEETGVQRSAAWSRGSFRYGADSGNPGVESKDPAALRDELISQLSGVTVTTGESGVPCTEIISYHFEDKRDANTLISTGVLACKDDFDIPTTALFFDDILDSTLFALAKEGKSFAPKDFACNILPAESTGGVVDFIWMIDNSRSMADEQINVANTADQFMSLLSSSTVDWRVGVTTTDIYCRGIDVSAPEHDPVYDLCNVILENDNRDECVGFRGINGFLSPDTPNVETIFKELVSKNLDCEPPASEGFEPGHNICGFGLESGIESTEYTLETLLADGEGACANRSDAFRLRTGENSQTVVIIVSDEEDQLMKSREFGTGTSQILDDDDATRLANTAAAVEYFSETFPSAHNTNLRIYSIVGDQGKSAGGICEPLSPNGVTGAEPGQSYAAIATATGGATGTVCSEDLTTTVEGIIRGTIGSVSNYPLPNDPFPISSSIRVAVGGVVISRVENGSAPYWSYVPEENAITFYNASFSEGEPIVIAYKAWKPVID